MLVTHVKVDNRTYNIYDSGKIFLISYLKPVTSEVVNILTIPSSRYYYLSRSGQKIPYLALADIDQVKLDVKAWQITRDVNASVMPIYIQSVVVASSPELDLLKITEGVKIMPPDNMGRYTNTFEELLQAYSQLSDREERFTLPITRKLIEEMMNYPFNPAADFIRASQLATNGNERNIQNYLDEKGIFHFRGSDIANLPQRTIFFYLTRFYGPPMTGDLNLKIIRRKYLQAAKNKEARQIARMIPVNINIYRKFQSEFDAYFAEININPDQERLWTNLGTDQKERFYNSFFDYLKLLGRPDNLPPLTLNTIRQLQANQTETLVDFIKNYPDEDINNLIQVNEENTRELFLENAAEKLLQNRVFIMLPFEATNCNNSESVMMLDEFAELNYPFLGKGTLATGFDCYTVAELFQTFESNRAEDGTILFRDPLNYNTNFRVQELREFQNALIQGRRGINIPQDIFDHFEEYVQQAELQASSDYQYIRELRNWSKENNENRYLMHDFWMTYFHIGMYMRQWKGPGYPYPIKAAETGQEPERSTATEIEITENISKEKITLDHMMERMPEKIRENIRNLTIVKRYHGEVENTRYNIHQLYRLVIVRGTYCIRMASGPWAYTGGYYLKQILNENIPGFDLGTNVEYVQ
jgi:hypothetical protein